MENMFELLATVPRVRDEPGAATLRVTQGTVEFKQVWMRAWVRVRVCACVCVCAARAWCGVQTETAGVFVQGLGGHRACLAAACPLPGAGGGSASPLLTHATLQGSFCP
jgi:hypothetical protein